MLNFSSSKKVNYKNSQGLRGLILAGVALLPGLSSADQELPALSRDSVIATISHDWDGDQKPDRAIMVRVSHHEAFLYVVDSRGQCSKLGGVIVCGMVHPDPLLELSQAGSLILHESDNGIGRTMWSAKTTIAWREGKFVVAGYDFEATDKNREFEDIDYSVNYLTGRKIKNGVVVAGAVERIALADWTQPTDLE